MAFQSVPNVAQVRVEGVMDGQLTINDLYFEISGGSITAVNLANIANAVSAWHTTNITPNVSEDWSFNRVVAIDLTLVDGPSVISGTPTAGGVTGESAPNNVAGCISFSTESRGRSFHGRNYIAGVPNSEISLNTMSPTFMNAMVAGYLLLVGPGTFLAGWQWGVVSRETGNALRPTGIITPIVNVGFTTNSVRSMRSREVGHGA